MKRANKAANQLRIIGGRWRGRKIQFPAVPGIRPSPDRVRETLFNWLQFHIAGRRCLDLFAGSGALGLEALSREAAEVCWVDNEAAVEKYLRQTLATLGGAGRVVRADVVEWLATSPSQPFDVVFCDPPFHRQLAQPVMEALTAGGWLVPGGRLYLETEKEWPAEFPPGWEVLKEKQAGQVAYRLLEWAP